MDAYSCYNQIPIYTLDEEHILFITNRGLYCYWIMLFGLINAGATYQRLTNKIFVEQIWNSVEVYVDDLFVKSKNASSHIEHLNKVFKTLRAYKMKLKPLKCAFGVALRKFLGFMVNESGIEANKEKIPIVRDMQSLWTPKEVQSLTRKVATLSCFVSCATDIVFIWFVILVLWYFNCIILLLFLGKLCFEISDHVKILKMIKKNGFIMNICFPIGR